MRRSKISKDLFIVSILTVITALTWIAFDAYRAFAKKDTPRVLEEQLETLNPEIDTRTLDNLSKRKKFHIEELILTGSPVPTATEAGGI